MALYDDLLADISTELQIADENFDSTLLSTKITSVIREVKSARKYPATYPESYIENDLVNYYPQMREIALYDYAHIGAYGETQRNEDGINRVYVDRKQLFSGILPISRV